MNTILIKNIKSKVVFLLSIVLFTACSNDDNEVNDVNVNYPSGIEDLSKQLKRKIDFASSINPDTITYNYSNANRINSLTSSRNKYKIDYEYSQENLLSHSKITNLVTNEEVSYNNYYRDNDNLTVVTKKDNETIDSTLWVMSGLKAIESTSYSKQGSIDIITKEIYKWSGENIEKYEKYEKLNIESSFNELEAFPEDLDKTVSNIISFYNLESMQDNTDYYLVKRTVYESYNEGINILRYLSNLIPVTESQKIYEIEHTSLYDEERRDYFENTGYTTFKIDNQGYPIRIATGGSNARKLDFIYE